MIVSFWYSQWMYFGPLLSYRTDQGQRNLSSWDVYYSGHASRHEFGCDFAVRGNLRDLVSRFSAVDERLAAIRIKAKYLYISLICAHARTEDKDNTTKDVFYDKLEVLYNGCPRSDIKMLVGDFNAKVEREGIFGSRKTQSAREYKRPWLQTGILNMVISSTRVQHRNIHMATWQ